MAIPGGRISGIMSTSGHRICLKGIFHMKRIASALIVSLVLAASSAPASADRVGVSIGTLECIVEGGIGLVVTSSKDMDCVFKSTSGREEAYFGTIRKYGLDIGITGKARMLWAVFAPGIMEDGALGGEYVGGSAEATAIVGGGANALLGGGNIALQPLSVQVQMGVNAALGVTSMSLRPAD